MKDHKTIVVKAISYFFILLFLYASVSKLLEFEKFQVQLAQSPLLSAYAGIVSYSVIIVEWLTSILLLIPILRRFGLYASLILMTGFTVYIFIILNFSDFVPCSCGGILEKLGWTEHLIFNIACVLSAIIAILIVEKTTDYKFQRIAFSVVFSSILIVALFLSSEYVIKKENNFTRRFIKHPIIDYRALEMDNDFYYFAGFGLNNIYLSNQQYPQQLTTVDSSLHRKEVLTVRIETAHPYKNIRQTVLGKNFYLYDGTVPIIFKGTIGKENTKRISYKDAYFNDLKVIDSLNFAIRTQVRPSNQLILGLLKLSDDPKLQLKAHILKKQIDGLFDSDGSLAYDEKMKQLLYTYTYRNQVIVMNDKMAVKNYLKTIDTVSTATVKTTKLSDGTYKMGAPAEKVNIRTIAFRDLLFVQSNLMGRHESRKAWRKSDVIDVYHIDTKTYVGSLYLFRKEHHKLSDFIVTEKYIYTLHGKQLGQHKITKALLKYFNSGKPKTD